MPALPPYIIEPICQQFLALLASREVSHPLGCHRLRIPDHVVFEKLIQVLLVFGCAYLRIADESCSATTLRCRRDEWIEAGAMEALWRSWRSSPTIGSSASNWPMWPLMGASRRLLAEAKGRGKVQWTAANGAPSARRC